MENPRAMRLSRFAGAMGDETAVAGPKGRRASRMARVQDAWLRDLSPRALQGAARELGRRHGSDRSTAR